MKTFKTRHQSTASFLRFRMGDNSHVSTVPDPNGRITFEFMDADHQCPEMVRAFWSGAPVTDTRALLDADRAVRRTVSIALNSADRRWEGRS